MDDKVFKTYAEQRAILAARGMIIRHPRAFVKIMQEDDYYNVINGYKKYFIAGTSPEKYYIGTTLEQIYALYKFDQELRAIFMEELLKIEKKIKSLIAYHFSEVYGYKDVVYRQEKNFKNVSSANLEHTRKMIKNIHGTITYYARKGNNAITHYVNNYQYVPLWVVNSVLSFGQICHFYSCMKVDDQTKISNHFNLSASSLNGFLYYLDDMRNLCAHGGRIYTPNQIERMLRFIPDTSYHRQLCVPKNNAQNYIYGKKDLLALFISLRIFAKKSSFTKTKKLFLQKEAKLAKILPAHIMQNIDREMGCIGKYLPLVN